MTIRPEVPPLRRSASSHGLSVRATGWHVPDVGRAWRTSRSAPTASAPLVPSQSECIGKKGTSVDVRHALPSGQGVPHRLMSGGPDVRIVLPDEALERDQILGSDAPGEEIGKAPQSRQPGDFGCLSFADERSGQVDSVL